MLRDRAKNTLHFFSGARACMNAANNCVEYALREGHLLLSSLTLYFGIERSRISNESKIAVNDCGAVEFRILRMVKINKSIGRTVKFVSEELTCLNLGRRACNDNAFCGIAARVYNNAIMRLARGQVAMPQEINITANNSHEGSLCKKAHERILFLEDGLISLEIFRRNITVFKIFISAWTKEIGIFHFEASGPTLKTPLEITPFRETMGESNKIIMKRPLSDGSIKSFNLCRTQLISVERLAASDKKTTATGFAGRSFDDRNVTGQRRFFADALNEELRLRCDRAIFHSVIGIPKNGSCVFPQMVPVGKINELERIELGKLLAGQMIGNVVQDLNNPLLLVGHNGADYTTKKTSCTTIRKQNENRKGVQNGNKDR